MKINFKIRGAKELDDLLKQLPGRVAGRVAANSLRAGARVIRDEAKVQAPVLTGELKRSIKVITGRSDRRDSRIVHVGVFGKEAPLAHIIEFGSVAHRIAGKTKRVLVDAGSGTFFGREVQHPGTPSRPFLRPAADAKAGTALDTIGKTLGDGIVKEALKLGGGGQGRR